MDFVPGVLVAGRFRLGRIVGSGGMGEVWAAEDLESGTRVALKRLLPAAAKHHEVVARFKREAFLLGRVKSDYVARVIDFVDDADFGLVLVMEFIEGPSLAHILEDRTLTVEESVDLAVDLLHALCDLHDAKIVHRDLKPGNIIMRPLPGRPRAVIVDFGISRLLATEGEEVTGITRANIALGTVEYMAPEQILSSRDVTPITDLYAVGVILFRAVKGHHAFGDRRGEELARAKLIEEAPQLDTGRNDDVARGLTTLVMRALKKKPAHRYASAKDMLAEALELEFKAQSENDLDDSTTDEGGATAVKPSPLAAQSMPGVVAPPRSNGPPSPPRPPTPQRPPAHSISDVGGGPPQVRGSLPSIPEAAGMVAPRASMPSIPDSRGSMPSVPQSSPRGSFASIPDMRPPPEPPTESLERAAGVPRATVALAVLTAFAVGAAVGLVLAPTSAPAVKVADAGACPPPSSASASPALAISVDPPPSAPATAAVEPSATASASAKPTTTATAPKPVLSGKMPPGAWSGPAPAAKTNDVPTAAPKPPSPTDTGLGEEPDSFVP
jgi:eukaryotic-like serine/threonine-protein kinase